MLKKKCWLPEEQKITTIILSKDNERDIDEIEEQYRKDISFIFVENMEEVIQHALSTDLVDKAIDLNSVLKSIKVFL